MVLKFGNSIFVLLERQDDEIPTDPRPLSFKLVISENSAKVCTVEKKLM